VTTALSRPTLAADEQHYLDTALELTDSYIAPGAEAIDRDGAYPIDAVGRLTDAGLIGMFVPREHGGGGASLTATAAVVEAVSYGCPSTGAIMAALALGGYPLLMTGSAEQCAQYLPEITEGRGITFALTEVGAGSDASRIKTRAERVEGGWHLRGEKIYLGNGGVSTVYVTFALTEIDGRDRISAFLVERDAPGVTIDFYADKMGLRGTRTSNLKLDTVVPEHAQVGDLGKGMRLAMLTLNVGRVTVAAQGVGLGQAALDAASAEASRRQSFGQPIIDHQGIGFRLADVATRVSAARLLTSEAAHGYDTGQDISVLGGMAKLYASEAAHFAADAAVQVFGGDGYCRPNIAERLYRDQRVLEIYEGASEIQRLVISRNLKAWSEAASAR
jgi:alkylation response protein AidB-like acyl-CoA dehydrogenase